MVIWGQGGKDGERSGDTVYGYGMGPGDEGEWLLCKGPGIVGREQAAAFTQAHRAKGLHRLSKM